MTGLNTLLAVRRTKGPSKSREELAGCGPAQPRRRQKAGGGERGRLGPKDRSPHPLQTGLQFLTKDLLRFWVLDSRREGRSETGRRPPTGTGGDWGREHGGEKACHSRGEGARQAPGCLSRWDAEGTKSRRSFLLRAFVEHPRAGTAGSAGPAPYGTAGSLSSVTRESSARPSPQREGTSNQNESTSARLCQGGNEALKGPANRSQINKGKRFRRDRCNRLKPL